MGMTEEDRRRLKDSGQSADLSRRRSAKLAVFPA